MRLPSSLGRSAATLAQSELGSFWKWIYVLIALAGLVVVITATFLGLPNPAKTISLAGYESRLLVPSTITNGLILLSDPEGGVNTFVMSKPPLTYTVPATLEQTFALPKLHYKYWVRHINAGSRLKMRVEWSSDANLQFCLTMATVESYFKGSNHCLVKLNSRTRVSFEYVTKHSGDHYFILESSESYDPDLPATYREPLSLDGAYSEKTLDPSADTSEFQRKTKSSLNSNGKTARGAGSATKDRWEGSETFRSADAVQHDLDSPKSAPEVDRRLMSLRTLAKTGEAQPEFYMVRGNVSFDMSLIQYDTNQAEDLFLGSFTKEFEFNRPEWLVLYNPSDTRIFSVTISIARRFKELIIIAFLSEFILVSIICCCCYFRYSNVPLKRDAENGLRLFLRKGKVRHVGDARSKSMEDVDIGENPWDIPPSIASPESDERRATRRVALSSGAAVPLFHLHD